MAFLDYNLARMGGISRSVSDISNRAAAEREAKKGRMYGAIQTGIGLYSQQSAAEKLAEAKTLEAGKGRAFDWQAANKLARERGGVRDWERGQGFLNKKELKQMEITARDALTRLEAELRKEGTDGDFNIDNAYMAAMAYGLAPVGKWEGPTWRPESWTEEDRAAVISRIETVLSRYDIGQASQVMEMVMADLDMYDLPEDPGAADKTGESIIETLITAPSGEAIGGAAGLSRLSGLGTEVSTTPLDNVPPGSGESAVGWTLMQSLLRQIAGDPNKMNDPSVKMYLQDAEDGQFQQSTGLEDFIRVLKRLGAVEDTTPQIFN